MTALTVVIVLVFAALLGVGLYRLVSALSGGGGKKATLGKSTANQLNAEPGGKEGPLGPQCPHPKFEGSCVCLVRGKEMKIGSKGPCKDCLESYLDKNSGICASCEEPILPGEPVGRAWVGAPHPFTHMYMDCCACGALYCGVWGEGEFIPRFPGGMSVMDVAAATGKPIVGNLDDDGNMRIEVLDSEDESQKG